jgi:hypothetical protein
MPQDTSSSTGRVPSCGAVRSASTALESHRIYTGIGSRETPSEVLGVMEELGRALAVAGWILRSGGANGADSAFERGADRGGGQKEIYLPWQGFNGNASPLFNTPAHAERIVAPVHPAWDRRKPKARMLQARNVLQVLGQDLATPTHLVLAWTAGGELVGGTATALRLAEERHIPIINLGNPRFRAVGADQVLAEIAVLACRPRHQAAQPRSETGSQ